jgi:hypothetical protein
MEFDVFVRAGTGACPYGYLDNSMYMIGHDHKFMGDKFIGD